MTREQKIIIVNNRIKELEQMIEDWDVIASDPERFGYLPQVSKTIMINRKKDWLHSLIDINNDFKNLIISQG